MGFIKNLIKKYAVLVPPIGLLIVAVLLFLPALWLGGKVRAQMADSAAQAQTIRSLTANVPSSGMKEQIKTYMDRLEGEVDQIEKLVRQSSQRQLVAYNLFPKPEDTSAQVYTGYGRKYQGTIENLLTELNALDAPSETEIRQRTGTGGTAAPGANMFGTPGATTRRAATLDPMVDALCVARAESISVYAAPAAFAWHEFWQNFEYEGAESAIQDCWNSQIALWIYEDVVKTIQAMNVGSNRVSTSPVKRLLGISFSGPVQVGNGLAGGGMYNLMMGGMGRPGGGQTTARRDVPNYITATMPSVFTNQATSPWTARTGGPEYDVIHFAVSVIIDNHHVLGFMQELCSEKEHAFREDFKADGRLMDSKHNQITILQNGIHAVDRDSSVHQLYRYGDGAAMRLDLVCEYLLNREGYDAIKPEPIKELLGQGQQQGGTPGMQGTPGFPGGMMGF